ncbi:MAG TPA: glycosyltransferase 87 family protein, partial [Solirubrobacteraceae bacterium]|nr:glycosyltransferase 87 family protein [Solirubrobacteraceae bacterium]
MSRVWRSRSALVALAVMLVAAAVLAVTRSAPTSVLPARAAIRDALRNQAVNQALAGTRWSSASASPLASQLERVTFSAGGQQVAQAAVRPDGTVDEVEALAHDRVPYGDWIAYEPAVLAALAVLFVLMAGVAPWRRLRNLDVLATLSLVLPVLLLERGYLSGSVLGALPGLAYLLLRCAWRGFARAPEPSPSTALFDLVTRRWEPGRRVRVLRLLLAALAIVFFMVGVSSPNAIDVAYAAMEGATRIIHGVLPYGHMPGDVIHGDTYPILSYALYVPVAWLAPVESVFSSVDGALAVAVLGALAVAVALYRGVAGPRPPQRRRPPSAETAGLRAGLAWLSFPPVLIIASTGTTDVVLAAMLAFAVLLWRRPAASMAVLAVAGWFKLSPFALVPLWLAPLRGPRLLAAIAAFVGVSAAALGLVVALGGAGGPA